MKNLLLLLAVSFAWFSCDNSTEGTTKETASETFTYEDISFSIPEGWEITEAEPIEGGYFVSCEKKGESESGMVMLSILDDAMSPQEAVNGFLSEITNNDMLTNVVTETTENSNYYQLPAHKTTYRFSAMGMKHSGTAYGISQCNKVLLLVEQVAAEDAHFSEPGFSGIGKSFACGANAN